MCDHKGVTSLDELEWLNSDEIRLLRSSFVRMIPACEVRSERFYERLFESDPSLRPLFPTDMESQHEKLTMMLASAIDLLDQRDKFVETCAALGKRHAGYGALRGHYDLVTRLLVECLVEELEPSLSQAERSSWTKLLTLISEFMLSGSGQTEHAPRQG